MKRKSKGGSKSKRSKLSKPKKQSAVPKKKPAVPKKKPVAPKKKQEEEIVESESEDTDSEDDPVSKISKSKQPSEVADFDGEAEKSRYEAFFNALNAFNHATYGTSKDLNVVQNASTITADLVQAQIGVKEFMHMIYTGNAFFPEKFFQDFELARVGVFVNFTMNGPFPSISFQDVDDRNQWHKTSVRRPWTFPVTPNYARKVVGVIRNTDGPADFQQDTLAEYSKVPKTFISHGTGTYFLGIWDMNKLEKRCEEFHNNGMGKTRDLKNKFRAQINKDCEEIMFDAETLELKKEIVMHPDTVILASCFGKWWGKRLKSVRGEEGALQDKQII